MGVVEDVMALAAFDNKLFCHLMLVGFFCVFDNLHISI
jgi:hypothetical protein